MGRILLALVGIVVVVGLGGFVSLGMFPPPAPAMAVHKDLSPDRFVHS
ncbi:hypothetical protein [Gluconacetobacter takamatsuzukensis]|uniref:Uncharacterized protein n=1 Tax=Gluconacetobacter takamatsuzukensis TaxID=1286190 RepID=A0A7W4KCJ4_9PROT|nr:hypothetical protein [Gluconacetobacter takamatsuzukensis]MBB2204447.1 hypothetical protein [Gluconacetobacter takamatsuzukensis]